MPLFFPFDTLFWGLILPHFEVRDSGGQLDLDGSGCMEGAAWAAWVRACERLGWLAGADWGVTTSLLVRQTGFLTLLKRPKFGPADYLRCLLNRAG